MLTRSGKWIVEWRMAFGQAILGAIQIVIAFFKITGESAEGFFDYLAPLGLATLVITCAAFIISCLQIWLFLKSKSILTLVGAISGLLNIIPFVGAVPLIINGYVAYTGQNDTEETGVNEPPASTTDKNKGTIKT